MRRLRSLVAAAAAGALLAGCAGLPTSGPVQAGEVVVVNTGGVIPVADQPGLGDDPKRIVSGFLNAAAAGFGDDFNVARSYLTGAVAQTWNPTTQVVVAARTTPVEISDPTPQDQVLVTVPVVAHVDEAGRYTEVAPGAHESFMFSLRQNAAGEWRISGLPDGVLMLQPTFSSVYRALPLYFPSPDLAHLIPELRYFPDLNIATYATRALLGGPSPWLRDAVHNPVPNGVQLSVDAVPVEEAVAQVDVTRQLLTASPQDQQLFVASLTATLSAIPSVRSVQLRVEGAEIGNPIVPNLTVAAAAGGPLVMMAGEVVVSYEDRELIPWSGIPDLTGLAVSAPIVDPAGGFVYFLAHEGTRLATVAEEQVFELAAGASLLAPTNDRYGWVWTGERVSAGSLVVADYGGNQAEVTVPWLAGRTVEAIDVSPGGARIAVLSTGAGGPLAAVAGVVRDETGTPVSVSEPLPVGAELLTATDVAWFDNTVLAILGTNAASTGPGVHLATVGGQTVPWQTQPDTVGLAASNKVVFTVDAESILWRRDGAVWVEVAQGIRDPAFAD